MKGSAFPFPQIQFNHSRTRQELSSFFSLVLLVFISVLLFQSYQAALIWAAGLVIHEMGHVAALSFYKIDWKIGLGWMGVWTESPLDMRQTINDAQNSLIHLSGPLFNLLYAGLALLLDMLLKPGFNHLKILAGFNAMVAVLNLIPLLDLSDGGKVITRMVAGLNWRQRLLLVGTVLGLFGLSILVSLQAIPTESGPIQLGQYLFGYILLGIWFVFSIFLTSIRGGFTIKGPVRGLSLSYSLLFAILLWFMMSVSVLLLWNMPFFLTVHQMFLLADSFSQILTIGIILFACYISLYLLPRIFMLVLSITFRLRIERIYFGNPDSDVWMSFSSKRFVFTLYRQKLYQFGFSFCKNPSFPMGGWRSNLVRLSKPFANIAICFWVLAFVTGWLNGLGMDLTSALDKIPGGLFILLPLQGSIDLMKMAVSGPMVIVGWMDTLFNLHPMVVSFAFINGLFAVTCGFSWRPSARHLISWVKGVSLWKKKGCQNTLLNTSFLRSIQSTLWTSWVIIVLGIYRILDMI